MNAKRLAASLVSDIERKKGGASVSQSTSSGGIGFAGILTIVFIVLKLVGVVKWSWLWVLSPLWIGASFAVAIFALIVAIAAISKR